MQLNDWKIPLNVAVGLHVLILLAALYLPGIFQAKPKFADIYSVSIVNIAEPTVAPAPSAKPQKATPPAPAKVQKATPPPVAAPQKAAKKLAPIAEKLEKAVPAEAAPVQQKSISLKPLKKKIVQEVKPPDNQARNQEIEQKRNQEIERKQRQRLAEALREEELLQEKAKLAQEALEAERKLLQAQQAASSVQTTSAAVSESRNRTSAAAVGSNTNIIENQYLAAVFNRLHQFWTPPEYLQQKPDLTTVVVITINSDGSIANTLFESRSGDRVFDQFVSKTIETAAPMPPIPPAMKKQRFEIGLRFRPGSIQ
jgi:colicin import membrane protein